MAVKIQSPAILTCGASKMRTAGLILGLISGSFIYGGESSPHEKKEIRQGCLNKMSPDRQHKFARKGSDSRAFRKFPVIRPTVHRMSEMSLKEPCLN